MSYLSHTFTNLSKSRFEGDVEKALSRVRKKIDGPTYGFFEPLKDLKEVEKAKGIASALSSKYDTFVVLGTGGSSLGGKTLCALNTNPFSPRPVHFLDNVDPISMQQMLEVCPLKSTGFLIISKSGATSETLCQLLCLLEVLESQGISKDDIAQKIVIITESRQSPLRRLGLDIGCKIFEHDPQIGGRFSVFSIVGLVPAILCGIDCEALVKSAKNYLHSDLKAVFEGTLFQYHHLTQGRPLTVLMPYVDSLKSFTAWFCQLWAESLGKNGKGSTPIQALGTVDQHSQLQLYRDGPEDKIFTLIYGATKGKGPKVSAHTKIHNSLSYLENRTMGDLLEAELYATATSLSHTAPVRLISFEELNEGVLGELLCHFMLETITMAEMMHINAFDQPGVEESKILTRKYLEERYAS